VVRESACKRSVDSGLLAAWMQVVGRNSENIVRLKGAQKFFGPVRALYDIDLAIGRYEIAGLIGDDGAGESPLRRRLVWQSSGSIPLLLSTPRSATHG
jgi:hypothetical protein